MRLPTGPAVTFLFTDIEGSTRLERQVGSAAWAELVARHDRSMREAIERHDGTVVKTEGDAFFAAFARPADAAAAAVESQRVLAATEWPDDLTLRVRMGLHVGEGRLRERLGDDGPEDYVGIDVNYAARIAAAGNGGQIVISDALADALRGWTAEGVALTDEGLRALKDFDEPLRLHRLDVAGAADDARPLRTLDPPSNLPGEVTPLVGRDTEVALVRDALERSRIVTLTGPGGSGKTRLALGVATRLVGTFPHGTWFVDLAAIRDPDLIESAIAGAMGVGEAADTSIGERLRSHLRDRTALLVLDNLEQLLPTASDVVAAVLRAAPALRLLVTSRELLRINGERGYPVPPLDADSGLALFEGLARLHRPDVSLTDDQRASIRAIVERLGGLPLAIELAAARMRLLKPGQILQQLGHSLDLASAARDVPERQRTLRAAITWSHDLLSDAERRLYRALGVFAGGFTLDAASAVMDPDGHGSFDLYTAFESLVDKSLVRVEQGTDDRSAEETQRFGLHPLLREYALERLDASGERAGTEASHARWMDQWVGEMGGSVLGPGGDAILRRLDDEQHNLRTAVAWSLGPAGDPAAGLRIMGATWRWFQQRGHLREGRALLGQLLARPVDDDRARIAGLAAEGGLAYWMDDPDGSRQAYEARLTLAEATGDPVLIADGHYDAGFSAMVAGDPAALIAHEQQALDLYLAAGMDDAAVRTRQALVVAMFGQGDYAGARALQEVNLQTFRDGGSRVQIADGVTLLAAVHLRLGDADAAWACVREGLQIFATDDNASGLARSLGIAAILQSMLGDATFGARIAGATYELVREKAVMLAPVKVLRLPDPAELAVQRFGEARGRELLAEGAATPLDEIIAAVLAAPAPEVG